MVQLLIQWVMLALLLLGMNFILDGLSITNVWAALLFVVVMGLLNVTVKPVLLFMSLPINLLTLGLFTFILNACLFWLATWLVPGVWIDGFFSALFCSVVFGIFSSIILSKQG